MNESGTDETNTDEYFANIVFFFFRELETLAEEPEQQCEINQYDNVAWEIKNFFLTDGYSLLHYLKHGRLSSEQANLISQLVSAVENVPDSVVNVYNIKELHLNAMRAPCWSTIRTQARDLIKVLEPLKKWAYVTLGIDEETEK